MTQSRNGVEFAAPAETSHMPETGGQAAESWKSRLFWMIIGWLILTLGGEAVTISKHAVAKKPDMTRSGMWQSGAMSARMFIDSDPSKAILLFIKDEGFHIVDVVHGLERWHGTAVCHNTGVPSGQIVLDGPSNGLKVKFDRTSGEEYELTFDRVKAKEVVAPTLP